MICQGKPWCNGDMDCTKPNAFYDAIYLLCEEQADEAKEEAGTQEGEEEGGDLAAGERDERQANTLTQSLEDF